MPKYLEDARKELLEHLIAQGRNQEAKQIANLSDEMFVKVCEFIDREIK